MAGKRWNSGQNRHSEHIGLAQLQGKTIVVVDDEENILSAMRVLLEQWGCKVLTALTGAAAMEQLSALMCVPDIIICDYLLRFDEIGLDVVTSIQQEFNEEIPSIIVTGTITPDRSTEMNALGIRLLHKPVNADGLLNTMLKMINLDQQSMDLHEEDCVDEVQLED